MKIKQILSIAVIAGGLAVSMQSCKSKPKDADVQAKVSQALSTTPGVSVSVVDGVVTLNGEVADDATKQAAESAAKALEKEGVKSVNNNLTVTPPPPPPPAVTADDALTSGVNAVLAAYKGVTADVKEGIITLRGDVKRADLTNLMQALNALGAKKIENQLNIK